MRQATKIHMYTVRTVHYQLESKLQSMEIRFTPKKTPPQQKQKQTSHKHKSIHKVNVCSPRGHSVDPSLNFVLLCRPKLPRSADRTLRI